MRLSCLAARSSQVAHKGAERRRVGVHKALRLQGEPSQLVFSPAFRACLSALLPCPIARQSPAAQSRFKTLLEAAPHRTKQRSAASASSRPGADPEHTPWCGTSESCLSTGCRLQRGIPPAPPPPNPLPPPPFPLSDIMCQYSRRSRNGHWI